MQLKILVADTDAAYRRVLAHRLEALGHSVFEAGDGAAAREAVHSSAPRLVFADADLAEPSVIQLAEQIKLDSPDTLTVVTTPAGRERTAMEALRAGAVNFLPKPADPAEVEALTARYAEMLEAHDEQRRIPGWVTALHMTLELPSDPGCSARVADFLLRDLPAARPDLDLTGLTLGLQEMIQNAIEHGNLGITYEEKSRALEGGRFADLVEERLRDPGRAGRRVFVELRCDRSGLECVIRDEGEGFDWRRLPDPLSGEGLLETHGRGIYLTRFSFDAVEYNEIGNQVRLVKAFPAAG